MKSATTLWMLTFLLAGCGAVPKVPDRQVVQVQIPVPCVDDSTRGAPAVSSKSQLAALPDDTLVLTLAKERLELSAWAAEVGPVLDGCRVVPVSAQP